MKTKLEQLTLSQFVDLVCGDTTVLHKKKEVVNSYKLTAATRDIIFEYRSIADPAGALSYLKHVEDLIKAHMKMILFSMCANLVALKQYGRVKEILYEYGLTTCSWINSRVEGIIQAKLEQARRELAELEVLADNSVPNQEVIRNQFDAQTAALMAHFKFQITPATIKATIYANLVARHSREVKAQKAAISKR